MKLETWPEMQRRHVEERVALIVAHVEACGGNKRQAALAMEMQRKQMQRDLLQWRSDMMGDIRTDRRDHCKRAGA